MTTPSQILPYKPSRDFILYEKAYNFSLTLNQLRIKHFTQNIAALITKWPYSKQYT